MKLTVLVTLSLAKMCIGDPPVINFKACQATSSDLEECLRTSIQAFFESLGQTRLGGSLSAPVEPLRASSLILGPGKELFAARLALSDIETYGWARTKFELARFDMKRQIITVRGRAPSLTLKSQYRAEGTVLDKSLTGEGLFTTILENVLWQFEANVEIFERAGNKYWRRITSNVNLEPENIRIDLGNQEDGLNRKINENANGLFKELRGDYEMILNAVLTHLSDYLFDKAPIKVFIVGYSTPLN